MKIPSGKPRIGQGLLTKKGVRRAMINRTTGGNHGEMMMDRIRA